MLKIVILALIYSLSFSGCTGSLPAYSGIKQPAEAQKVTIENAEGELPPHQVKTILDRMKQRAGDTEILKSHVSLMEATSGQPLVAGNRATLLVDGPATYASMIQAIEQARDHINLETYIFEEDEQGARFADVLLRKQAGGVHVNLIYDSVGSKRTSKAFFERLKKGGVNVLEFNPIDPLKAKGKLLTTHRDHRKLLVIDGKVAFTGGINISDEYSSSSSGPPKGGKEHTWRDTHVRIEGPAVAQFQRLFLETWQTQKGPPLAQRNYFPPLKEAGKELVRAIGSTPLNKDRVTYVMYLSMAKHAKYTIYLVNAYFVPDNQFLDALKDAARRGVDVRLVLPGKSDHRLVLYAGRAQYGGLLKAGVKIYERADTIIHAKPAVVDGIWSTIGSTNLETWSFVLNDEINAIIIGPELARQMEELFQADVEKSKEITPEEWSSRPISSRLWETVARLFSPLL